MKSSKPSMYIKDEDDIEEVFDEVDDEVLDENEVVKSPAKIKTRKADTEERVIPCNS